MFHHLSLGLVTIYALATGRAAFSLGPEVGIQWRCSSARRTDPLRRPQRVNEGAAEPSNLRPALKRSRPWNKVRALGNRLRHEYGIVREDRLWDIVQTDLRPLCGACEGALRGMETGDTAG